MPKTRSGKKSIARSSNGGGDDDDKEEEEPLATQLPWTANEEEEAAPPETPPVEEKKEAAQSPESPEKPEEPNQEEEAPAREKDKAGDDAMEGEEEEEEPIVVIKKKDQILYDLIDYHHEMIITDPETRKENWEALQVRTSKRRALPASAFSIVYHIIIRSPIFLSLFAHQSFFIFLPSHRSTFGSSFRLQTKSLGASTFAPDSANC